MNRTLLNRKMFIVSLVVLFTAFGAGPAATFRANPGADGKMEVNDIIEKANPSVVNEVRSTHLTFFCARYPIIVKCVDLTPYSRICLLSATYPHPEKKKRRNPLRLRLTF
jgi:hypothetical protein